MGRTAIRRECGASEDSSPAFVGLSSSGLAPLRPKGPWPRRGRGGEGAVAGSATGHSGDASGPCPASLPLLVRFGGARPRRSMAVASIDLVKLDGTRSKRGTVLSAVGMFNGLCRAMAYRERGKVPARHT